MPISVDSIEALQDEVVKLDRFKMTGYVESHGLLQELQLTSDKQGQFIHIYALKGVGIMDYDHYTADTIVAAFEKMAQVFAQGAVYLQTILVEQPQDASDELVELTKAACSARFAAAPMLGDADMSVNEAREAAINANLKDEKNFGKFMTYVQAHFDESRLEKALQMLRKERFELFSEVSTQGVLGIVKSQTNRDLIYACRLVENGSFTCCTQNLKPCGGLRGALCKHLLVLIIGLAKANQLDLVATVKWIQASTTEKPVIDKPVLTEVFLKYSGVEAGEIDWRPTETTPEDYYAF